MLFTLSAMAQNDAPDYAKSAIQSAASWIDIDYAGDGLIGHKLDIHLPKTGKAPFPVVVCIYGSAWLSNNWKGATFTTALGQKLMDNGYAVVSINYRSSSEASFPAQIQDVKAAIRFVRNNSNTFSIDSNFIGVTGWSSGGHLAALTGTTNNTNKAIINGLDIDLEGSLGSFTASSSKVTAVVDWFGPANFLNMDSCGSHMNHNDVKSPESLLIGGAIQDNKAKVALANPASYANRNNPPFLIFHGDKDPLVPHCQSEQLYQKLQQESVPAKLIIIPWGEHGPGVMIDRYYDQMIAFFNSVKKFH